jgi:hypothetical protein
VAVVSAFWPLGLPCGPLHEIGFTGKWTRGWRGEELVPMSPSFPSRGCCTGQHSRSSGTFACTQQLNEARFDERIIKAQTAQTTLSLDPQVSGDVLLVLHNGSLKKPATHQKE